MYCHRVTVLIDTIFKIWIVNCEIVLMDILNLYVVAL